MKKRLFTIISIIFSILFLIYMVITHFELNRLFLLKRNNLEYYINKYSSLPKINKNKVVISIPVENEEELKKLELTLKSVLDQSVKVDDIVICSNLKIPKKLSKIFSVYSIKSEDLKGIIPVFLRERDKDTKIIQLNPKIVYGKYTIADLLEKENDCIFCNKNVIMLGMDKLENKNNEIKIISLDNCYCL